MKSPLKAKPLRNPGDSTQRALDDLVFDKILGYVFASVLITVMAGLEWLRYIAQTPIVQPWLFTAIAIITVAFSIYKIFRYLATIRNMRLGLEGEKAVGQFLETLRESGAKVFHDVPGDKFNLDHVVIAPSGIYLIETKTYSKPDRGEPTITFDGTKVTLRERGTYDAPVIQAKAGATWLKHLLQESTGKRFPVRPVLVFPGWFIQPTVEARSSDVWVLNPKALPSFIQNSLISLAPDEVSMAASHLARYIRNSTD